MTIQLEFWHLVLMLISFFGFVAGFGKLLLSQIERRIGERLDSLDSHVNKRGDDVSRLERELLELKAKLPEHYVRREDWIRGQTVIEAKLDRLAVTLENVQIRGNRHA